MLLNRLRRKIAEHDWFAVAIELLVVIAGILIALQVGEWSADRERRAEERTYLQRLRDDLLREDAVMERRIAVATTRIEAARLLDKVARGPELDPADVPRLATALRVVTYRSFPQIDAFVYRELVSSGKLGLIRSDTLRRGLADHYAALENYAQVGTDLEAQHLFERDTTGILTIDETMAVESAGWQDTFAPVSLDRGAEIARAFRERKQAIAVLPNLAQHHTFNIKVIEELRKQGAAIVKEID